MKKGFLLWIFVLVLLSSFVSAVDNSLVIHYAFDNSTTVSTTGLYPLRNWNNLNMSTGIINNATNFTNVATKYLENGSFFNYSKTGNFSTSFWINARSLGHSFAWNIVSNGNTNLNFRLGGNNPEMEVYSNSIPTTTELSYSTVTTNRWYHVVINMESGKNMSLYVNGTLVNSSTVSAWTGTPSNITIGINPQAGSELPFNGTIDDMCFLNRTLNTSEIVAIYQSGTPTTNCYDILNAVPSITNTVTINTPTNNSAYYVGNHNYFDVNVTNSGFGGNVTTQVFLYNSTDSLLQTYFGQNNPYLFNFTNLSIGTYKINATSYNFSNFNISNFNNNYTLTTVNSPLIAKSFGYANTNGLRILQNLSQYGQTTFNITNTTLVNITISAMFYSYSGQESSAPIYFITSGENNPTYAMYIGSSSTRLICDGEYINTTGSIKNYQTGGTLFSNNEWTNLTCNYVFSNNSYNVTEYINGVEGRSIKTLNDVLTLRAHVDKIRIGRQKLAFVRTINGTLDNLIVSFNNSIIVNWTFDNFTGLFGFENSSTTTTASIYNSTSGSILTPDGGYNSSTRFLNISWTNATFNPVFVSVTNTTLYLLNDDLSINRSIFNFTSSQSFNNYTYDLYVQNLSVGMYYVRLDQVDVNGNGRTTSNRFNITTNTLLNITAKTISGATINNFTINAYNSLYGYNTTTNTTNGFAYIDHIRGNINLSIDATGYSLNFSSVNLNVTTGNHSYQFTLYETNTFNITFYSQANPTILLTGINISLDLISNAFAQNYTTNNGTLYLPLLIPETYTIRYYSQGYTTRFYYFTLNNRSYEEIKLYLINSTNSYNFTVYIVNQVLNPVEGAIVKNLKYDLATNSYLVQEIGTTDVTGKTTFTVTYNDEYYKQIVEYPSGTLKKTTTPDYIDTPSVVIPISLGDNNIVEEVINYDGIGGNLVFNNLTDNFRFDWSDTSLVASQYCLNVYRMTGLSQDLFNDSCGVGSSAGTILLGVANGSGYVYYAVATYYEDGVQKYLTSLYHEYPTPTAEQPLGNKYGLFIQLILTLGMTSLVVLNIGLAMILAPFSLIIGKILGWNVFNWVGLLALQIVGIILAVISSMRR